MSGGQVFGPDAPCAVVVGLCAHGLACVRALARAGVRVYALEAQPALPGCHTRHATVVHVPEINGPGVVAALQDFHRAHTFSVNPVLFLTNDNMVRHVAANGSVLESLYSLSWTQDCTAVLRLMDKAALTEQCRATGLLYPRSADLFHECDGVSALAELGTFPVVVKPARPLSGFKARRVDSAGELSELVRAYEADLPFVLQEYIPGGDGEIFFAALYLRDGRATAACAGRKLLSHPPAMGQTTAAEIVDRSDLVALAERFFEDTGLDGPVSLEFKIDGTGRPWVIEPTVGRTDYWLDCCIANGFDLPLMEYRSQAGLNVSPVAASQRYIWLDAERDPAILVHVTARIGILGWWRRLPRFTYWRCSDPVPVLVALVRFFTVRCKRFRQRLRPAA